MIEIHPLAGVPEIEEGDDLAAYLLAACEASGLELRDGDVVCVAQKAVSKAEGAFVDVAEGEDLHAVRRRLAREQASRIVADTEGVLITETPHGFVLANGGIDASNVTAGRLTLLPEDPDRSASQLAAAILERSGVRVGVVVTDTFGRPWRLGQTDVAIGVAGIRPLRDERGGADRFGRPLEVTLTALADELAAAADLARRKADGTPFVLIRGAHVDQDPDASARELIRPPDEDLFREGRAPS